MLADAAAALRSARSYHVAGMLDTGFTVDVVVVPNGSTGTVKAHGVTWTEATRDGKLWFRGRRLWQDTLGTAAAQRYGERWVRVVDLRAGFGWAHRITHLQDSIPGVVFAPQDGLTDRGVVVRNRVRVVELTGPDDIYDVRAGPPHYPVRWLEKDNPGPNGEPCGISLDRFDAGFVLHPPQTPLVLGG